MFGERRRTLEFGEVLFQAEKECESLGNNYTGITVVGGSEMFS